MRPPRFGVAGVTATVVVVVAAATVTCCLDIGIWCTFATAAAMDANMLWDSPLVTNIALPARTCKASTDKSASFVDGTYDAPGGARIGYRLMPHPEPVGASGAKRPVLVHFHGNAEVCSVWFNQTQHSTSATAPPDTAAPSWFDS